MRPHPRSEVRSTTTLRLDRLSISNGGFSSSIPSIPPNVRAGSPDRRIAGRRFDLDDIRTPVGHDPPVAGAVTHTPSSTTLMPSNGPDMALLFEVRTKLVYSLKLICNPP